MRIFLAQYDAAIADFDKAIDLEPDDAEAYVNRAMAKVNLAHIDEAKLDFQTAGELAEQQGDNNLKVFVESRLQELNNSTPQDSEI